MGFGIEIKHETIVIGLIIAFLMAELFTVDAIVTIFYNQISYQQQVLAGMTASNFTNAPTLMWVVGENQAVNIITVGIVLYFLYYLSKKPIDLLKTIVEKGNEKHDDSNKNETTTTKGKKPKK